VHHLGVAVADMAVATRFYTDVLGMRLLSGPFDDPIQRVRVCFLGTSEGVAQAAGTTAQPSIELIAPLGDDAPIHQYLRKEIGAYHVCYEVADFDAAIAHLRANRSVMVSGPAPAVAFGGRRIAWFFLPTRHLIEVVERG
jgi:methylmalonyl-CoA/ethylmalonyl-CoA epimerase